MLFITYGIYIKNSIPFPLRREIKLRILNVPQLRKQNVPLSSSLLELMIPSRRLSVPIFNQQGQKFVLISQIELKSLMEEREKLLSERATLLTRLASLTNESLQNLHTIQSSSDESLTDDESLQNLHTINSKGVEIEELRNENAKLRERIFLLESQVSGLQADSVAQDVKISALDVKISAQDVKISAQDVKISALLAENEYRIFIMAIQDINSLHQLEKYPAISKSMRRLRLSGLESANYILTNEDSPELTDYKISVLTAKLQSDMTAACRHKFEKKMGKISFGTCCRF